MFRKKTIVWIIIIVAIIASGYFFVQSRKPKNEYTTVEVKKGNILQTVSVTGELVSEDQVDLAFKISGRVRTINVDINDQVTRGQLLASVEPGTLNAELKQAQEQVKFQKETLENMKLSKNEDTFSKEQRDAQRAQIRAAEANVSTILARFGDNRLFSPIDGIVLKRNVELGEIVLPTNPILSIGNPKNLIIESNVPESDIAKISVDQKADVTFDALPSDRIFETTVISIDPSSTVIQDVVSYRIKLNLASADDVLKPGMSANIDVKTSAKEDVLMIPIRAVKTEGKQKFVDILIDAQKNITRRENIQTGLTGDEGMIEVVSGLEVGQQMITFVKTQ